MGCRCDDIPRCSHDIRIIEKMKSSFNDANEKNENVSTELYGLAGKCFSTFFCKDMNELETEEKKLNRTLSDILPNIIKECEQKVLRLDIELMNMIAEDTEFHDEERRKSESHHHHDD